MALMGPCVLQVTGEEEEQRTAAFKALFKPYDIMG